jgi:peroxiredoxin Q/BCP
MGGAVGYPSETRKEDGFVIKVGELAPDFVSTDHTGKDVRLRDLEGRTVVLWFYPKANTPGCTAEGRGFAEHQAEFEARDVVILGISLDSIEVNAEFAKSCDFPFPLLCDVDREIAVEFGAVDSQEDTFAKRMTYVIDAEGKVMRVFRSVKPQGHAEEVLEFLDNHLPS